MTLPNWPRTDAEQIRNTQTFQEARVQLDARQPSSAAAGGLTLERSVQPTITVGEALAPVFRGTFGENVSLLRADGGAIVANLAMRFSTAGGVKRLSARMPALSDLAITGYGIRRKTPDNSSGAKFNCVAVYFGNGSQGQGGAYQRDVMQLPMPFQVSPDDGVFYGGWFHQPTRPIPVQSIANSRMMWDIRYDVDATPIIVSCFWTYEFNPSLASAFTTFYPRTS